MSTSNDGYYKGEKYISAQGIKYYEDWCVDFVSYCSARAGLVRDGVYPSQRNATCNVVALKNWYTKNPAKGTIYENDGSYIPRIGDIAMRLVGNEAQHVGIVARVNQKKDSTIEAVVIAGNRGDRVSIDNYVYNQTGTRGWTYYISLNIPNRLAFAQNLSKAVVSGVSSKYYTGDAITQKVTVKVGGKSAEPYSVSYENNVKRGQAAVVISPRSGLVANAMPRTKRIGFSILGTSMYRLYNPNSGEHFYTRDSGEKNSLVKSGWKYEGIAWYAPKYGSGVPVYRLYNANSGDHHYTLSSAERDSLKKAGWRYEGISWYSDKRKTVPVYRQYNPRAKAGSHNYTVSVPERNKLISIGWRDEGVGWYGC